MKYVRNPVAHGLRESALTRLERRRAVRRSLSLILLEGAPAGVIHRIIETFFTPFALLLKATSPQIGLLTAMPSLLAALAQLGTPRLVDALGSRRRVLLASCVVGIVLWLPIALLPWIFGPTAVWWLLALATLAVVVFYMPAPAWGSWVPQLVPARRLGKFMARRGTIGFAFSVGAALAIGRWLDLMHNHIYIAFMAVFLLAMAMRLTCFLLFFRAYEPPLPGKPSPGAGAMSFVRTLRTSNLGRFIGYTAALNFAVAVAAPFFTVFMLEDLRFSYTKMVALQLVDLVGFAIGLYFWGRLADRRGTVLVLKLATPLVAAMPLLWLVTRYYPWLMVAELVGALGWSGWQLGASNFVYECAHPEDRSRAVAYFNASNGVGIFLGALLGGFLAPVLPHLFSYSMLTLFLISGVLRAGAMGLLVPFVREVRQAPKAVAAGR
jgi:MFS family permease